MQFSIKPVPYETPHQPTIDEARFLVDDNGDLNADASALNWGPGFWPKSFVIQKANGEQELVRSGSFSKDNDGDLLHVGYFSDENPMVRVVRVMND